MIKTILNWLIDAVCEFWPEIFGFLLVLCLILFFLRIRRKRRLKKSARQKPESEAEAMEEAIAPPSPDEEGESVQAPSAPEDTSGRAMPEPEVETAEGREGFFR